MRSKINVQKPRGLQYAAARLRDKSMVPPLHIVVCPDRSLEDKPDMYEKETMSYFDKHISFGYYHFYPFYIIWEVLLAGVR